MDLINALDDPKHVPPPAASCATVVRRILTYAVFIAIAVIAIAAGLRLRVAAFEKTIGIHFEGDVGNGFHWGIEANHRGLFHVYDQLVASNPQPDAAYLLDYTPLRLAVVNAWAHWAAVHFPGVNNWQDRYDLTAPMLWLNTSCELISAVLVFLLIRFHLRRRTGSAVLDEEHGLKTRATAGAIIRPLLGALLFWFNPAVVLDAHSWPQWDVWLLPFFLGAVLLANVDAWFFAGLSLAIGAFLKGQVLMVAPIFVLWPIFQWRISAMIRVVCGFGLGCALCATPWMGISSTALTWLVPMIVAIGMLAMFPTRVYRDWRWLVGIAVVAMLLAWPLKSNATMLLRMLGIAVLVLVGVARPLPRRLSRAVSALAMAMAIFLTIPLFGASKSWLTIGFGYGARKYQVMGAVGTYSLPMILESKFGVTGGPAGLIEIPFLHRTMAVRTVMGIVYMICLALSAVGAALQSRRRNPRFLVAMIAPWLCMFVLLPQMNNRYLVWAAGLTALLPAVSCGMTLLGVFISILCCMGVAEIMYRYHPTVNPAMTRFLGGFQPDMAWVLALLAGIFLYVAITPGRRNRG